VGQFGTKFQTDALPGEALQTSMKQKTVRGSEGERADPKARLQRLFPEAALCDKSAR